MNSRKHVKIEMDSGLGSDEDRRGRTKEQKQLHNQQLLSGCFIDAASLSDESEVAENNHRRNDERRQGALIFQSSIPQFSMLQISDSHEGNINYCSSGNLSNFPETSTPYNSIVQLDLDEPEAAPKTPLGFYVDLSDVPEVPKTPPSTSAKKNIFSMVIDFEAPKKDKPTKLSSSYVSSKKAKPLNKNNLLGKSSSSLSSSVSSINSTKDSVCVAGTSRQSEEQESRQIKIETSSDVECASFIKETSISSKSSSISEIIDKCDDVNGNEGQTEGDTNSERQEGNCINDLIGNKSSRIELQTEESKNNASQSIGQQFVKLSDLECQKPRVDLNFTPRMSRSIPESSWVESPLFMSRSAGYRSAPHPLEAEVTELSDSESISFSTSQPRRSVQRLGTDLLRMFLEEIGPDVTVEVDGHKLKAHKCILASRCQYFAALISGHWLEASGNIISLQGFSYESVYFSLCHIYSGAAHVPDSISLVELASLADMLGLEGLKEVVEHALKQRHCHNFHRPCAGCCIGVLEVLPLSAAYGLDELYQKCLQWITQHFVRVWPNRAFASLPRELREKCYQQHVVHMTPDKVLETILNCDKVLSTLPALRWAEPVTQLVLQLTDACHLYHRQHFAAVLHAPSFLALDTGLGWNICQVEDQVVSAARNLGVEQACKSYTRCCKMLDQIWSRPFNDLLNKIKLMLEQCLVSQADRLIRSNAWLRLDTPLRSRIKELTPTIEPASRLPRATPIRNKKLSTGSSKTYTPSPILSSSDSSRNSSPSVTQTNRLHNTTGSPSLRRSLLLAARAPQVPPSPSTNRKSTLTQPTAASAAKSAQSKSIKSSPRNPPTKTSTTQTAKINSSLTKSATGRISSQTQTSHTRTMPAAKKSTFISRNQTVGKKEPIALTAKRTDSRCNSPLKSDSRTSSPRKFDSRVTSPIKVNNSKPTSPRKVRTGIEGQSQTKTVPTMQRSSTFLKEEPTVLGKVA